MKKAVFAVLALFASFFFGAGFAAEQGFRFFISENPPAEILALVDTMPVEEAGEFGFSSKGDNVFDFGIHIFIKSGSVTPDVPDAFMLVALSPLLDEKGETVSGKYSVKLAGFIFLDEQIAWFASEEAKSAFIKAFE
ncbi:hypothetical protein A2W54_01310 [Candidatus Giovannonibacteria bacterium RIFCSPHIGHO2_02_43_13]|uniref:Uncharacterized protein n=1 Tax=Candidatus Giovannonibacteria bacterium RIFCSPHIGHO2_02_43_13 TaxID=1798330 RepID=A0A1F5WUS2_9BACT|nr:MAG: hypothetical protein UW28_C0001G0020 [Parcubacteria group bacterium GW2011_GWA2_44_13]OGF72962.1 MAG: hypothetical protein A3E06_03205 [Candidatus Giovannonibacteria bacterium RIFCSPHIGHO2_12_FULL_44_42]OGF79353.1 MAG: hypothetical protein A2W54_01310 [Candidatus Giovannonibacteria bacterium RIFCSPHIGHO2_02_43_13]OGF90400.1 MAG: hypothetical protein A3I94_00545 [Candidatus Giovannonibacteria bacterium RIFCSPLOWO2_02_FULL_43_54]OGF97212.1 MAG: hypothetical protein A3H08_03585 [Candidatus